MEIFFWAAVYSPYSTEAVRTGPYSVQTETKIYRFFRNFRFFGIFMGFPEKKAVLGENREIFVKEVFFVDFCLELEDFWVLEVNLKIFVVFEIFGFGGNLKILKGFA